MRRKVKFDLEARLEFENAVAWHNVESKLTHVIGDLLKIVLTPVSFYFSAPQVQAMG
jgi:hypothetical protein